MTVPLLCGAVIAAFAAIFTAETDAQIDLARTMRENSKKQVKSKKTTPKSAGRSCAATKSKPSKSSNASKPQPKEKEEAEAPDVPKITEVVVVEDTPQPKQPPKASSQPEQVFTAVEQPAEFPGGLPALMKWLCENIRYPEAAVENKISGRVVVRFIVEKDGSISSTTVVRGVDKDLDREALRVIGKMPKWIPGKNNGSPVRSYYNLPVTFRL